MTEIQNNDDDGSTVPSLESMNNMDENNENKKGEVKEAPAPKTENNDQKSKEADSIESEPAENILTPIVTDGVDPLDCEPELKIPFLRWY